MIQHVQVKVHASFPPPALDHLEERISLNATYIKDPLSTFLIDCEGDSMINAFIPPKARLLIDRSITAKNGDIVLAELNGEFTVKYLEKSEFRCRLIAANPKYPDIELSGEQQLQVWGVVTAIIIEPKAIPSVPMKSGSI